MPLTEPAEVSVTRSTEDASVVVVSWRPFTLVEARGFIEYIVQLHEASSSKRQQPLTMRANMTQSSVTFTTLGFFVGFVYRGRIYKTLSVNILEALTYLNLILLSAVVQVGHYIFCLFILWWELSLSYCLSSSFITSMFSVWQNRQSS